MNLRRPQRMLLIVLAVAALTASSLTGPLLNQLAAAHPPAVADAHPAIRLTPQTAAQEAESAVARRRDALAADAATARAAEARRAGLAADRATWAEPARAEAVRRLLQTRAAQEQQRLTNPAALAGITTPGSADVLVLDPASTGHTVAPMAAGSYTLTAVFGQTGLWFPYHTGQDFGAPAGTPVYAVADGVVGNHVNEWWAGGNVVVHHADATSTMMSHLSSVAVAPGTIVHAGDLVGHVGNTGRSYGAHLHFEVYPAGTVPGDNRGCVDPVAWLAARGVTSLAAAQLVG